ncbi:HpcH/HpaI aldolase/citrate lyase family protein [Herbiconiux sp. P15]|uniref:HpcH/HpaI aldolase/citrate lyase family protein n=1 Tax=Herbiconiux liukaitaii TaxID=3342799 RepID=UPI0035B9007C
MRHFSFIDHDESERLFHKLPSEVGVDSPPAILASALGGTLYSPGNRTTLVADVVKQGARGCFSMVLCLEDSVADDAVEFAEKNVAAVLGELATLAAGDEPPALPLLFVRVRTAEQMIRVAAQSGAGLDLLSGFVIPKYENENGYAQGFFDALHTIQAEYGRTGANGHRLRVMPILESPVMIHAETRASAMQAIADVTKANRDDVLAVRIGATDLSSAFGLRRSRDLTVYDVTLVSFVIAEIVNVFGRPADDFVITGPVWEHFQTAERLMRPQLRVTPFAEANEKKLRHRLVLAGLDGLIREISLDQANGLLGKTVIHPSHVPVVHALSVVSHEEYLDAAAIADGVGGGATASPYRNKMNEMKPHQAWARKTLLRAEAFGVAAEETTFVDLLEASMR